MAGRRAGALRSGTDGRAAPAAMLRVSFQRASALWVFAAVFILFALWVPNTFLTSSTWKTLLDEQAITGLVAVGLVLPLAAGAFDLAIGTEVGLGSIMVAWLLMKGMPVGLAVLLSVGSGCAVGLASGWLVVKVRIDSFVATLGMSSVLLAVISWISGDQQIVGLSSGFQKLGNNEIAGVALPVYIMLVVSGIVYYVLEHTAVGRRIYATGGNIEAARLAGVGTSRVIVGTLVACGAIACLAGVLVSSQLATGDPTIGPPYLLPAFSAAFLGSTQFRGGRFNVWGTIVAVYVLATGVKGLQLAGAPTWIPDLFNGVALLIAVGLAKQQTTARRASAIGRMLRRRAPNTANEIETSAAASPATTPSNGADQETVAAATISQRKEAHNEQHDG
jgi:ribose transport system permease protein